MAPQSTKPLTMPFAEFLKTWWYAPLTIWRETFESFYHPQLFLGCNIQDMDDEYHVLNEVGSYGKQLSRIQKVLDVLVTHLNKDELTEEERLALEEYRAYTERVAAALAESRGPRASELTTGYVDRLEKALQSRRVTDRQEYDRILKKLQLITEREATA